jgi:hypothetical protein
MTSNTALALKRGGTLDAESQAMIYDGLNLSQLEIFLDMDINLIREKLVQGQVAPCGKRNGADIYRIKDVLPWVVKPGYDIEQYLRNMHHSELPKMLTKEFWAGQRSKQEYELKAGDLWGTATVIEKMGEVFKLVKMSALLTVDTVERQVELTDHQRQLIKNIMDGMLIDLSTTLQEKFKKDIDNGNESTEEEL